MIEAIDLTRRYGSLLAVDRVTFEARPGAIVGLLGPNGAGKTTIMKMLTGYLYPHEGSARVCGHDVVTDSIAARECIGYLPESTPLYDDLTVNEYLEFICGARGLGRDSVSGAIERVVRLCSLEPVVHRTIGELSRGFRQRVGLAQAIVHDPEVVVLDEPTSGLDPNQIQEVRGIIRDIGRTRTVMVSTHILGEVETMCDEVLIVNGGQIVARGTAEEISRELTGDRVVAVTVIGEVPDRAMAEIGTIGAVIEVLRSEGTTRLRIALSEDDRDSDALFDWAARSSLRLRSLVPERHSLESVFRKLTGEGS